MYTKLDQIEGVYTGHFLLSAYTHIQSLLLIDLIFLEESVGPKLLVSPWVSGFTKLESLRLLTWRGRWVGLLDFLRLRIT